MCCKFSAGVPNSDCVYIWRRWSPVGVDCELSASAILVSIISYTLYTLHMYIPMYVHLPSIRRGKGHTCRIHSLSSSQLQLCGTISTNSQWPSWPMMSVLLMVRITQSDSTMTTLLRCACIYAYSMCACTLYMNVTMWRYAHVYFCVNAFVWWWLTERQGNATTQQNLP